MPVEIKELVIRTVLEDKSHGDVSSEEIGKEVKRQVRKMRAEILAQCVEAVNEGLKRQMER
jgi:hypothetical protein